jgi:uncharacterized repeat protein (TIGR01451 family)
MTRLITAVIGGGLALLAFAFPAQSAIVDTGDVQVIGNDIYIGTTADGTRTIDGGSADNKDNAFLGNSPGVTGTLRVGFDFVQSFFSSLSLIVGNQGNGSLIADTLGVISANQLVLGKEAGSSGQAQVYTDSSISLTGAGNALIVGDAGSGHMLIGAYPDAVGNLYGQRVIIANQAGSNGEILKDLGTFRLSSLDGGEVYLGIGVGGQGSYFGHHATVEIEGQTAPATVEIGVEAGASGVASLGQAVLRIAGNAPTLTVGKYGSGRIDYLSAGGYVSLMDTVGTNARMFIGRYPGSLGRVRLGTGDQLTAGTILRIGLDENDNPGGSGDLSLDFDSILTADLIKVGPNGRINLSPFCPLGQSVNGNLINGGVLTAFGCNEIRGDVTNNGLVDQAGEFVSLLNTVGSYVQTAQGTHQALIDPNDEYNTASTLSVEGTASFDGRVEAVFASAPTSETVYTLITATGGITYAPTLQVDASGLPPGYQATPIFGANAFSLQVTPGVPVADLAVTQSDAPDPVRTGQELTYTASVMNLGPDPATGVVLTDTLPAEVALVSAVPSQGSCTGSTTVNCSLGSLANGASATVVMTVQVIARPGSKRLVNTVNVTAGESDPNGVNNAATAETRAIGRPHI